MHVGCDPLPDSVQFESQNEQLLSSLHDVEAHKQELEQVLADLKGELDELRSREKALLADESETTSASLVKQAMEQELEEREARHMAKVQKLQAEIVEKETEITNITK